MCNGLTALHVEPLATCMAVSSCKVSKVQRECSAVRKGAWYTIEGMNIMHHTFCRLHHQRHFSGYWVSSVVLNMKCLS